MTTSPPAGEPKSPAVAETDLPGPDATPAELSSSAASVAPVPRWALWLTAAFALVSFLPLAQSGLWEPFELSTADQARRVAVNLFGAASLEVPGAANDLPTLEEVGRGELPVLWVAAFLRVFGMSVWSARLAMASAAGLLLGLNYWGARKLWGPRVALISTWILLTTPAFLVQARGAFGDATTLVGSAAAFYGAAIALFHERPDTRVRLGGLALALCGALVASFSRGVLVGVTLPCVAVGLGAFSSAERSQRRWGAALVALGLGAGVVVMWSLWRADVEVLSRWVGSRVSVGKKFWTHDQVLHFMGHAFFPWSVLIPAALGSVFAAPRAATQRAELARRSLVWLLVTALAVYTALGERTGLQPFAPVFAIAIMLALASEQWSHANHRASVSASLMGLCLLALLVVDFHNFPEKAYSAFSVVQTEVPDSFSKRADRIIAVAALVSALPLLGLALSEAFSRLPRVSRLLAALQKRAFVVIAFTLGGTVLSFGYYPRLAAALSPTGVFDAYRQRAADGEPLGILGTQSNVAAFHGAANAVHFDSETAALTWLTEEEGPRRWLALKGDRLSRFNSKFRRVTKRNVPIFPTESSELLLAVNRLTDGEVTQNPVAKWLPESAPALAHPMSRSFGGALSLLGWEIRRQDGAPTDDLVVGEPLSFVLAYQVTGRITKDWRTFIHIDGQGNRFNGDHDTLAGEYSLKLLHEGDFALDVFDFKLEADMKPGKYAVYFGLFLGDERFDVTEGEQVDNRVSGGTVQISAAP